MSFTYEWRRDGTPIGTGNTHVVVALDVGTNITCAVTATNALGSTTAVTDELSIGGPTTGTGAIAAQRSAVIATGTVAGGLVTGTGALAVQIGHVVGTGSVTGALGVTGIGLLAAQSSDVDASGSVTGAGVGLLIAQVSDVDGVGAVRSTGTGVLTAQASDADGGGLVTGAGIGTLVAQQADVDGVGTAAFASTTTVTAPNGQWWKFNGTLENGTFVNGDPWVKTASSVSLIEVSTMPVGTGTNARNGGMINPTYNTYLEQNTSGIPNPNNAAAWKHGFDGRVNISTNNTLSYDVAYNAHASLPLTMTPGQSLVSSVSYLPELTEAELMVSGNIRCSSRMACVTVVDYTPFADEFRPAYFGTTKTRRRFSDINTALLPDLTAPFNPKSPATDSFHLDLASVSIGTPWPPLSTTDEMHVASLRDLQFWIYPSGDSRAYTLFKPVWNMDIYPRDNGAAYSRLAMYVMCDFADRDDFLTRILQVAIDANEIVANTSGQGAPFAGGAGYYNTPLWFIRFAGLLFDDADMKNAVDIPTGLIDYEGQTITKWGERNRVYYSPTAKAQYRRVPGQDYSVTGFPLYGDTPLVDYSGGMGGPGSNGTFRDPNAEYDMHQYKYGLPTGSFPDILDDTYEIWKVGGVEQIYLGTYMHYTTSMMGGVCASFAMDDEAFWGGAIVDFCQRWANDPQMWENWGVHFDYVTENTYHKDIKGFGGMGNLWMTEMWELVVGIPVEPPSDAFDIVTFDGASDYLTRGADLTTIANGTEFTFVIRCNPIDNGSPRLFICDAALNFVIYLNASNILQMQAWGAGLFLGFTTTAVHLENADGMQTIFVSGRTTGTPTVHCYKGDVDMVPGGVTAAAGTIDFTSTNWSIGSDTAGTAKFQGDVAFVWFDTRYYDVSDVDVRAMWATPALLGVDGSGPGFEPKIYMTGTADVWNAGTNHALGGNFVMSGAVSGAAGDTTAPVLSSAVATATGATTGSLQVSTNEGNGTLYWVVTYSATPPTASQVKLGQTNTGAAAPDSGSQAVSGSGVQTVSGGAGGLTAATACFAYFMHEDAATNKSTVATDGFTTDTVDTTAPVLSSPVATELSSTTASLTVTTDEANGTLYWVVTLSATPPTAAQIKLGQNHASAAAPDSGSQAVSSTGAQSISGGATGLSASTAYFAYFMHEDASTNQSNVATDGFTTSAPASSFTTVTFGSGDALTKASAPMPDATEFTMVCRCQATDTATARAFFYDNAGWVAAQINSSNRIVASLWSSSAVIFGNASTTETTDNADGMRTIFIAARTSGTPVFQMYYDDGTSIGPTGTTVTGGTIHFNVPNWNVLNGFEGDVQFFWLDNVYYDISDAGVRADWLAANIGGNGEGPGATPKIYFTGNAAAWNSGVNLGTGGNFTMSGAVT